MTYKVHFKPVLQHITSDKRRMNIAASQVIQCSGEMPNKQGKRNIGK